MKIAIDGPSGVGKSTLAKAIASEFNLVYVDTGAMYRMIGFYFLDNKLPYTAEEDIRKNLCNIHIELRLQDGIELLLNGRNVEGFIRTQEVAKVSSTLAQYKCVREKLTTLQKEIASKYEIVMDGRDIASNIIPNADIKIYLDADARVRTKRRMADLNISEENFDTVYNEIIMRDEKDFNREFSPLRIVSDALVINTDEMNFDEVKQKVFSLIKSHAKN